MWMELSPFQVVLRPMALRIGLINYKRIHEKANIPIGEDIVPYIRSHYTGEEYQRAMKIVEEEELLGQQNVQLQPGMLKQFIQ